MMKGQSDTDYNAMLSYATQQGQSDTDYNAMMS